MTESITNSTLFNNFAVFREIIKAIPDLLTANSKWSDSNRYFEDFPNPKSRNFPGYPIMVIETEAEQESLTIKNKKMMNYTTTVTIYGDSFVEVPGSLMNTYLNAIVEWFNKNKDTLRWTYGLWGLSNISKDREKDEIMEKELIIGTLTFDYHVTLDMTN